MTETPKIGQWIAYRSLSSGSFRQGRITKVSDSEIEYFNSDALDGFGMYETVSGFEMRYATIN